MSKLQVVLGSSSKNVTVPIRLGTETDHMDMMVQDYNGIQGKRHDHFYDVDLFTVPDK